MKLRLCPRHKRIRATAITVALSYSIRLATAFAFAGFVIVSFSSSDSAATAVMQQQYSRNMIGKLTPERTVLLLCDVQERFIPLIYNSATVVNTCRYLTSVAKALKIPILATQQYTKAFGPTVPDCFADPADLNATPMFEKKLFSMLTPQVQNQLSQWKTDEGRDTYIVVGIEAHVCVQQTCLGLLEQQRSPAASGSGGGGVHLIVDAVSSQQVLDRTIALQRLQTAGAFITTAQSAAFMLMQSADHEQFKTVSKLTVEHMKLTNQFNQDLLR